MSGGHIVDKWVTVGELGDVRINTVIESSMKERDNVLFLMDTGATTTTITEDTLIDLGIRVQTEKSEINEIGINRDGNEYIMYKLNNSISKVCLADGRQIEVTKIILPYMRVLGLEFINIQVIICGNMICDANSNPYDKRAINLLGTDILKYFNYRIFNQTKRAEITRRTDYKQIVQQDRHRQMSGNKFIVNSLFY